MHTRARPRTALVYTHLQTYARASTRLPHSTQSCTHSCFGALHERHAQARARTRRHSHTHMCTRMLVPLRAPSHAYTQVCMHARAPYTLCHTRTHICTCLYKHLHACHTFTQMCLCTHVPVHAHHTNTHMHRRTRMTYTHATRDPYLRTHAHALTRTHASCTHGPL